MRRWLLVVALALMVNVGYGAIFYSFSVLIGDGAAAGEFSRTVLSASLGLGLIVSGMLALVVGTVCDVLGPKRVFLAGAALGFAGLAAFSRAEAEWQVIAVWALLLGPAMACAFYEPAYVAIDQWFTENKGRAIGLLTVVAGLSSAIFIPLTQWLVDGFGWRGAALTLGGVMLCVIVPLALFLVRDRPREGARLREVDFKAAYAAMLAGVRHTNRAFWLVTAAFFLGLSGTFGMLFHQVAHMQDLGFPAGQVASVVGVIGIISLPARFLLPALGDKVSPSLLAALVFALLAVSGTVLIGAEEWWRIYLYVALFGVVFGSVLPMRAVAMSRLFSGEAYGRLMGLQQTMMAPAMAGGPFLVGALRDTTGSYAFPWIGAVALLALAIAPMLASGKAHPPR
ncbi:MAG: MFS transporter [Rubrobacter sp.]|nr:MFS transporter [Rubrobacter sp.]